MLHFSSPEGSGDALVFLTLHTYAIPFDAFNEGIPRAIGVIFGVGKLKWMGYNLVKVA